MKISSCVFLIIFLIQNIFGSDDSNTTKNNKSKEDKEERFFENLFTFKTAASFIFKMHTAYFNNIYKIDYKYENLLLKEPNPFIY